jgi:translation elongation factor EF-Tu-like GTPase
MCEFITASIWLKPTEEGGRQNPVWTGYRPHLVAKHHNQYMGVYLKNIRHSSKVGGIEPGTSAEVELALVYFDEKCAECVELYQDLRPGTEFEIHEGANVIGYGCVQRRFCPPT